MIYPQRLLYNHTQYLFLVTREVAWPPKGNDNPKLNDGMGEIISSAAKKYVKTVESENQSKHGQYTLSRGKIF